MLKKIQIMLLMATFFLHFSCRKQEAPMSETAGSPATHAETFFNVPPAENGIIKRVAAYLHEQNKKYNFVGKLIRFDGIPKWEKSFVQIGEGQTNVNTGDTLLFIPLVPEGKNQVYSFIWAKVDVNNKISWRLYSGRDYDKYPHGKINSNQITAEKIAAVSMLLDYRTFGHKSFTITDADLFSTGNHTQRGQYRSIQLKASDEGIGQTAGIALNSYFEISYCYYTEVNFCPFSPCYGPNGTCDRCSQCQTTQVDCFTKVIFIPEGGGGGGGTIEPPPPAGGGGGGDDGIPGNGDSPDDPCVIDSPCGRTGWSADEALAMNLAGDLDLNFAERQWLAQNAGRALDVRDYLTNSTAPEMEKYNLANGHIDRMMSDASYLYFLQTYAGQYPFGPTIWWEGSTFLAPYGGTVFGNWAINYLNQNTTVPFSTFENWFFKTPEYSPGDPAVDPDDITYDEAVVQATLPTLSAFEAAFPKNGVSGNYTAMPSPAVYQLVGGSLYQSHLNNPGSYANACAVRGSRGLLYSGITIPVITEPNAGQRTQKGGDNKNYILDAVSFNKFMIDKFGAATHSLTSADANDPAKVANLLNGKNGIYVIVNNSTASAGYSGHVDLILNGKCISGAYTTVTGGVQSIRIWVLN